MSNRYSADRYKLRWWERLHPKHISIQGKIQITLFIAASLSVLIVAVLGFFIGKATLEETAYANLTTLRDTRMQEVEHYFKFIRGQIQTFSEDKMIVEGVKKFRAAFHQLDGQEQGLEQFQEELLQRHYTKEYLPRLTEGDPNTTHVISDYWPGGTATSWLQYYYIAANPQPVGSKDLYNKAMDGSEYSQVHNYYHPVIRNYLDKFGYYDIFLIDPETGHIIYSVYKELDFATTLLDGPYSRTNIARVFTRAKEAAEPGSVFLEDFEPYAPSYFEPASFISSPIYDGDELIGILIFQMQVDEINALINVRQEWRKEGIGSSAEVFLLGADQKMRSNVRSLLTRPNEFFRKLYQQGQQDSVSIERVRRIKSPILQLEVNTPTVASAMQGQSGLKKSVNYLGEEVLSAYAKMNIMGLQWYIFAEISQEEAFRAIITFRDRVSVVFFLVFALVTSIGFFFARNLTQPIRRLNTAIRRLAEGRPVQALKVHAYDEVGQTIASMNDMIDRLQRAADFAVSVGNGQFDADFQTASDEDAFGSALIQMRDQLRQADQEAKVRSWITSGLAEFAEVLRNNNDDINRLSDAILFRMIEYVGAAQGAFFIVNENQEHGRFLELTACYAYNRRKYLNKILLPGEGLAGQCLLDKDTIYINDIPKDYAEIRSGMGASQPKAILIVPFRFSEEILGVIELATLKDFQKHEIEFVEKIAESVGSTVASAQNSMRTTALLQESQRYAQELRSQEEEMRQNTEELQTTQEELQRKQAMLTKAKDELEEQLKLRAQEIDGLRNEVKSRINEMQKHYRYLENTGVCTFELDRNGFFTHANESFLNLMKVSRGELEGKRHNFIVEEQVENTLEYKKFWDELMSGITKTGKFRRRTRDRRAVILKGAYNVVRTTQSVEKVIFIGIDVTKEIREEAAEAMVNI